MVASTAALKASKMVDKMVALRVENLVASKVYKMVVY